MTTELATMQPLTLANGKTKRTFGFAHYKAEAKALGIKGKREVSAYASEALKRQTEAGMATLERAEELGFFMTKIDLKKSAAGETISTTMFRPATKSKDALALAEAKLERAMAEVAKLKTLKDVKAIQA